MINHISEVFKKYAVFSGRATRAEYWYFMLFNLIVITLLEVASFFIEDKYLILSIISVAYSLVVIIPSIAVFVRRMHDIGKSGWWWFICLIPVIGVIWFIILLVTDSEPGENKYGPNPKGVETT